MPFTPEDAEKHKKGMTDKMKKQWARVAESIRKREMKKGVSEKDAAASAIKQANGVVMMNDNVSDSFSSYKTKQVLDYEVKLTLHQKKAHIVAPVVMMVEGVHNGSQGPLFHEITELGKFPASWNGIPVIIHHPTDEEGNPVSANSPDIVDNEVVGRVYNTEVDGIKLKSEIWLDEDKLNEVSPETLASINNSEEIEVSLGMFTENEMETGTYKEEDYVGIAHNHRPDHLAILPDQTGACSCKDGCGIGANQKDNNMERTKKPKTIEMISALRIAGYSINEIGDHSEQGYNERMQMIYDKLRSLDSNKIYNYLEECYDDYLIYSKSGDNNRTMYKQTYKIESGKIEFVGEPIEVHKKVEYVVNSSLTRTKFSINNKMEDKNMPKNDCPKCLEKINAVIANAASGFVETDREWLETLSETALDKALKVKEVEKVVEKTVEVNKLSPADQADLAWARDQRKVRRSAWIKGIQDNTEKDTWTDAELNEMNDNALAKLHKSVTKDTLVQEGNYSLNSGRHIQQDNSSSEEPLYPADVKMNDK